MIACNSQTEDDKGELPCHKPPVFLEFFPGKWDPHKTSPPGAGSNLETPPKLHSSRTLFIIQAHLNKKHKFDKGLRILFCLTFWLYDLMHMINSILITYERET